MTDPVTVRRVDGTRKLDTPAMPPDYANLEAHDLANEYPMADPHEFAGLKASIAEIGIREPIKLFQGKILDGRNRYKAAKEAGHQFTSKDFQEFIGTLEEAEKYVYDTNNLRRHLSEQQKQEMVKRLLVKNPKMPSRKLARLAGVSHTTIVKLRQPQQEDKTYISLMNAWGKASIEAQEKFVRENKTDLVELLGS